MFGSRQYLVQYTNGAHGHHLKEHQKQNKPSMIVKNLNSNIESYKNRQQIKKQQCVLQVEEYSMRVCKGFWQRLHVGPGALTTIAK